MLLVDNLNNLFRICRVDIPIQAVTVKLGQGWLKWTLGHYYGLWTVMGQNYLCT